MVAKSRTTERRVETLFKKKKKRTNIGCLHVYHLSTGDFACPSTISTQLVQVIQPGFDSTQLSHGDLDLLPSPNILHRRPRLNRFGYLWIICFYSSRSFGVLVVVSGVVFVVNKRKILDSAKSGEFVFLPLTDGGTLATLAVVTARCYSCL